MENLFDGDGVAMFDDYKSGDEEDPLAYNPRKVFTKVRNIARILYQFNDGAGPEIVLFQEFNYDRTPRSSHGDLRGFLERYTGMTVEDMLRSKFSQKIFGLPAEAFLLKFLKDHGLRGYPVVKPAPGDPHEKTAHNNIIFTKFPVSEVLQHPLESAGDILEVHLRAFGYSLVHFNNH